MSEIAKNIKTLREQAGFSQEQLGEKLGKTRSAISQYESGAIIPRMGVIEDIASIFNVRKSEILGETSFHDRIPLTARSTATIPVVGKLHAGNPQDIEDVDKTIEIPASVLAHHPKSYGWIVEGDCMDKVYPEGCTIVIDTAMEPQDGSIGAVRLDGYQEVMRRIHKGANTLILSPESWNPEHEDIVITKDSETTVEFVGTVVWFQASEEME